MAARQRAEIVVMGVILYELEDIERKEQQKKRRKRWLIREINKQRLDQGDFNNLVQELRGDEEQFFVYFRMTPRIFDELLRLVGPSSLFFFILRHFLYLWSRMSNLRMHFPWKLVQF